MGRGLCMCINGLNAEHEALLEQLELPEGISIKEIIKVLEDTGIEDTDCFEKRFNEDMLNSIINALKNMVK